MGQCLWTLRFEVLGLVLVVIATGMTIFSGNGLGIVALFAAGVVFCLFNKFCCYMHHGEKPSCSVCDLPHSKDESVKTQEKEDNEAKQVMDNEGGSQTNRSK